MGLVATSPRTGYAAHLSRHGRARYIKTSHSKNQKGTTSFERISKGASTFFFEENTWSLCEYLLEYIRRVGRFSTGVFLQRILAFWSELSSVRSPTYFGQKP